MKKKEDASMASLNNPNTWSGKWNYAARVKSKDIITHFMFSSAIKRKINEVEELAWTEFEQKVIDGLLESASNSLEMIGLKPITIDPEQILILDQEVFLRAINSMPNRNNIPTTGFYSYGYIYLPRMEPVVFISTLAHELSHALSFYRLKVEEKVSRRKKSHHRNVEIAQIGLNLKSGNKIYYEGSNEAITEHWAKIMINNFSENCSDLNLKGLLEKAGRNWTYCSHVALMQEVFQAGSQKREDFFIGFFLAYFKGASIDELVREAKPSLVKAMRKIRATNESLEKELKRVGAHGLLARINGKF